MNPSWDRSGCCHHTCCRDTVKQPCHVSGSSRARVGTGWSRTLGLTTVPSKFAAELESRERDEGSTLRLGLGEGVSDKVTLSRELRWQARFSWSSTCKGPEAGHTRMSEDKSEPEGPEQSEQCRKVAGGGVWEAAGPDHRAPPGLWEGGCLYSGGDGKAQQEAE